MNSLKLALRLTVAVALAIVATAAYDQPASAVTGSWGMCAPQQSGPPVCGIGCAGECECNSNSMCDDL